MAPIVGRIAFNIGFSVFILAVILLPFLDPSSAEFVVDVLAVILSGTFTALVAWSVRRASRLPSAGGGTPPEPE
jgi:hypothetical protein